jgi:hypothetical protein
VCDDSAEEPDRLDGADDAASADEITNLERAQEDEESSRREVREQPTPATPIATPPAASSAANVVVSTPKKPRIATINTYVQHESSARLHVACDRDVELFA